MECRRCDASLEEPAEQGKAHADLVAGQADALLSMHHVKHTEEDGKAERVAKNHEERARRLHRCIIAARLAAMQDTPGQEPDRRTSTSFPPHDLGGRPGFGPVPVDDDAIFTNRAEARVFGLTQMAQSASGFNTDGFRHGIEREDPDRYLALGYWGRWLSNAERMLTEGGVLPAAAVDAALAGEPVRGTVERSTECRPATARGARRTAPADAVFTLGERVRVHTTMGLEPRFEHCRIPGYVRGRIGTVEAIHDSWILPDDHAHGRGDGTQGSWVYNVSFPAAELFAAGGDHTLRIDLFEPYLTSESAA